MPQTNANASDAQVRRLRPLQDHVTRLSEGALFFKTFLTKGRAISSAVPSSPAMAEAVLAPVRFERPVTIIELGAGTGAITERIARRLRPQHRFLAVENDPNFCRILRRRFPDLDIVEADATRLDQLLATRGISRVDYVLSGLPTPALPRRGMVRLWHWLREALAPDGMFVQITVAPLIYRSFYDRLFESVRYQMVWLNVPPGGVYYCQRPRCNGRAQRRS